MQISVLSGKGGTGKTTIAIGIAELIQNSIKVDCDVDASNMHLFFKGDVLNKQDFCNRSNCIYKQRQMHQLF